MKETKRDCGQNDLKVSDKYFLGKTREKIIRKIKVEYSA